MIRFQQLGLSTFDTSYALLCESASWLNEQQLPAWLPTRELYYERHLAGQNYGLFHNTTLCAVVSIMPCPTDMWIGLIAHPNAAWIASLARTRQQSGVSYGKLLMQSVEHAVRAQATPAIYLDCYSSKGRLPQYYKGLGYEELVRKDLTLPDGSFHNCVLMRKILITDPFHKAGVHKTDA